MTNFPKELQSRYEYRSVIGSGASGILFRALDNNLNISVAIKMLSSSYSQNSSLVRFQKEAKASAKLNHDHIVKIRDFGILEDDIPYMVLDYVSGFSVKQYIETRKQFDLEQDLMLVEQVAMGMEHAHRNGIVHRDLKSSNIMVESQDRKNLVAKVIDFGIAQFNSMDVPEGFESTGNKLVGTPAYISPESIRAEQVDERADIYSLGCVFYELMTGELPYEAEEVVSVMELHLNAPIPSLVSNLKYDLADELAHELDEIAKKCLAKDCSDRYQSMNQLAESIANVRTQLASASYVDVKVNRNTDNGFSFNRFFAAGQSAGKSDSKFQKRVSIILAISLVIGMVVIASMSMSKKKEKPENVFGTRTIKDTTKSDKDLLLTAESILDKELGDPKVTDSDIIEGIYKPKENYSVRLGGTGVTDIGIKHLKPSGIHKIDVRRTNITDQSLKLFSTYPHLLEVTVNYTPITDKGVAYLVKLKNLKRLYLEGTAITDESLKAIGQIKSLEQLNLGACRQITKAGFKPILRLPNLNRLKISSTKITPADLKGIEHLLRLTYEFNDLTLEDIDVICSIKGLKTLTLTGAKFPPGGFVKLASAKDLNMLNIAGCRGIVDKEARQFRKIKRLCYIQSELTYKKSIPNSFFRARGIDPATMK